MSSKMKNLCQKFGEILGGTASSQNNMCIVTVTRDIPVTILKRPSPTAASGFFAFNSIDKNGKALNLGEFVLREKEVNPFIDALRQEGIKIASVKEHWLFVKPQLVYVNFESIDKPLSFAKKVRKAFRVLID